MSILPGVRLKGNPDTFHLVKTLTPQWFVSSTTKLFVVLFHWCLFTTGFSVQLGLSQNMYAHASPLLSHQPATPRWPRGMHYSWFNHVYSLNSISTLGQIRLFTFYRIPLLWFRSVWLMTLFLQTHTLQMYDSWTVVLTLHTHRLRFQSMMMMMMSFICR